MKLIRIMSIMVVLWVIHATMADCQNTAIAATSGSGAWVRTGVRLYDKRPENNRTYQRTWENQPGKITVALHAEDHNYSPELADEMSATFTWSGPPATLAAGEKASIRMALQLHKISKKSFGGLGASAGCALMKLSADPYAGEPFVGDGYPLKVGSSNPPGTLLKLNGTAAVPSKDYGDGKMQIYCNLFDNGSLGYVYEYAWSDTAKPSTVQPSDDLSKTNDTSTTTTSTSTTPSDTPQKEPADVKTMTLQAGKRTAKPGETVTVPVYLINGSGWQT